MSLEPQAIPPIEADPNDTDEQVFNQWANQRFALYQQMEQQIQAGIAQTLQVASEFTTRMEAETDQLLARYRQQRSEQEAQLDTLHQEMRSLQEQMAKERQAHNETLAKARQQGEALLAQQHRQALTAIEKQRAAATAEREQILRDAYTERDRVLAETRQLSTRLAELQQALQGLLGAVAPMSAPTQPLTELQHNTNSAPPSAATDLRYAAAQAQAAPAPSQPEASALDGAASAESEDTPMPEERGIRLAIENIDNFTSASRLIDKFEQSRAIEEVNLVEFEEGTLLLFIRHTPETTVENVLREEFNNTLEFVEVMPDLIRLRSHN
jgi:hypothetical protein